MNAIQSKRRLTIMMLGCMLFAGAIVFRAAKVQIIGDPRLEAMSKRQFQAKVLIRPRRGTISDRSGDPLAINVEAQSLAANPAKIQNRRTLSRLLSKALDLSQAKLYEKLGEKREFVWIKRHLSDADLGHFKRWQLVGAEGDLIDGLWLVKESKRVYPHGELAAHTLGDVNLDTDGLEGVELWTNEWLRGKIVSVSAVKDALGRPTFIDAVAAKDVKDGEAVQLTLDSSLQFAVEHELKSAIARTGARSGSVIVMDAVSGEILALANEPTFNPNSKNIPPDHRRNRAITDGYEPGSTLKPILLAGALSSGIKLSQSIYGEEGSFMVQGKKISEAETHEKFKWLNLKQMIQVSSNVVAAKLALKVGADRYYATLKTFGFGSKTEVGFPGEISGKVPLRREWSALATANIGFGQGILVTPLQMARAYAAFVNGGWLVQPTLIKGPSQLVKVEAPKRILNPKVNEGVLEALKSVTEKEGTGAKAALEGYTVAGKTGTAQVVDSSGKYSKTRYISSFIGTALGVDPKLVILALLDEPRGVYYASETAAPLFKQVLSASVNRFSLPSLATTPAPLADKIRYSLAKVVTPADYDPGMQLHWEGQTADGRATWRVPRLQGLTSREALQILQGHSFKVEIQGMGIVGSQVPEAGKPISEDGTIRLSLVEP